MTFDNQCGSCLEFKDKRDCSSPFDSSWYGCANEKGYCDFYHQYFYPDDSCGHYKNRKTYVPSPCYITTVVCNILGYSDNCGLLNTLRNFRDNVMQKNIKYREMLYEYDTVGPIIAKKLEEEYKNCEDIDMINGLFNFFIQPTVAFISANKFDDAVSRYFEMTKSLEEYYSVYPSDVIPNNYDDTKGGHGNFITKKLEI